MTAGFTRDAAAAAAVLGFFSLSWFGWALENPPSGWRTVAYVLMAIAVPVTIAGGVLAVANWDSGTVFDRPTSRSFGIVVGIEFVVAAAGALLLQFAFRRPEYVAAWVALVVGVHFIPLGSLLRDRLFYVVAALVIVVALAAIPAARGASAAVSATTGLGTGIVLLGGALFSLATVVF